MFNASTPAPIPIPTGPVLAQPDHETTAPGLTPASGLTPAAGVTPAPATGLAPALANATAPVPTPNQFRRLGYARRGCGHGSGARAEPRLARTDYSRDVSEPPGHLITLSFPLISLQHTPSLSSLYNTLWSNHFLEINLVAAAANSSIYSFS